MKKRLTAAILVCLLLFPLESLGVWRQLEGMQVSAKGAALYDPAAKTFLYEKQGDTQLPMASTTKIMTALLVLEHLPLEEDHIIKPEWTGIEGSSIYLKAGEKLTTYNLLCGLLLESGNDAAVALSCLVSGSEEAFCRLMNEKAAELGLVNTHFQSASGLDGDAHYTTAKDLAVLTGVAMAQEEFAAIVSQKTISTGDRVMKNHNKLLTLSQEVCGVKTGFTKKAGRCLVSAARREGRLLIAVTLGAPDDWNDHLRLYDSAFALCAPRQVLEGGAAGSALVLSGEKSQVELYYNGSFAPFLTEEERQDVSVQVTGPRTVCAPVQAGKVYGTLQVRLGDGVIYETPVYYKETVEKLPPAKTFWQKIWQGLWGGK